MYDIKFLEDEWKKYKKKKRRPWFMLLLSIFLILLASFTFLNYKEIDILQSNNKNKMLKPVKVTHSLLVDEALTTLEKKHPKIPEVKSETVISNKTDTNEIVEDMPIDENTVRPDAPQVEESISQPHKKMHLNIIETTSVSAYKDVAKRFYQSHDTDDSLFLAKSYYRKGNYKKAEYWALQTNKVNGNIEESWLIFAKSKVKLGHRNEAIHILTTYLKKSDSAQVKSLLYKIKKGTL
ncbi:MAG: hypothetical protein P794_09205 [Epsilonproteobacteria bacterium (ex Lamellibrachia satsuma)]|nr:MAG: hypothetical protein P794_09205 [Epsilonproteobacteria bacterium (ex Lamellibrachia satsuma)]